jgi:hypothetical protein
MRIAKIAKTQAASARISCTNPRMKPVIAPSPTKSRTAMSKPVID